MDIYLVQHGQALSEEQDAQRPLSDEGRGTVTMMAEFFADRTSRLIETPIQELRHSGKLRAQQTADIMADILCPEAAVTTAENMNPKDDPRVWHDELMADRDRPGALMLVGHLPHLGQLAGLLLTGDANLMPVQFVNAGVLKVCPAPTGWAVAWYLTPACAV